MKSETSEEKFYRKKFAFYFAISAAVAFFLIYDVFSRIADYRQIATERIEPGALDSLEDEVTNLRNMLRDKINEIEEN